MSAPDGTNSYSFRETYWDSYTNELSEFQDIVEKFYNNKAFEIQRPYECCLWVIEIVNALQRSALSGQEEYVYPTTPIHIGFINTETTETNGNVAVFVEKQVIQPFFWDFFHVTQLYDPQNPSVDVHAVYICATGDDQYKFVQKSVCDKKHVLCEKPTFRKLSEYISAAKQARAQNTKLE